MKFLVVVLFLSVMAVSGLTQTVQNRTQASAFEKVERIGEATKRSFFVFSTQERNYAIRHDGHGEGSSNSALRKNFDLKMKGATRLERVYFAEFEGDLLLEYEVTNQQTNWGYLLRMDQKSMKPRWITQLNGHRLGPGLVDGSEAYLSASSFFMKIDLNSGAVMWQQPLSKHSDEFALPVVKGDAVLFRVDGFVGRTFEVEKLTGREIKR